MNERKTWLPAVVGVASMALSVIAPLPVSAQQSAQELYQLCAACHTVGGGRLVGPDLQGVTERRDEDWLIRFIRNPIAMKDAGDPAATQLFAEFAPTIMPPSSYTDDQIREVLAYIAAGAPGAGSASTLADRPATPADIERGQQLFQGLARLENGGPACNACHDVQNDAVIGGGVLAAELTTVFSRMGGSGVGAILGSPPFPVMQEAYSGRELTDDEKHALIAFLQDADANHALQQPRDYGITLLQYGVGLTAALMLVLWLLFGRNRKARSVNQAIYDRQVSSQ